MSLRRLLAVPFALCAVASVAWWAPGMLSGWRSLHSRAINSLDGQRPYELFLSGARRWVPCKPEIAEDSIRVRCAGYELPPNRAAKALAISRLARQSVSPDSADAHW